MNQNRVVSRRPPYVPITLTIRGQPGSVEVEALIDTGFDGEVIVPAALILATTPPIGQSGWRLADGSQISTPAYTGVLQIGGMRVAPIAVTALGDEPIIGRAVTRRFTVTFDHDRQVVVEP